MQTLSSSASCFHRPTSLQTARFLGARGVSALAPCAPRRHTSATAAATVASSEKQPGWPRLLSSNAQAFEKKQDTSKSAAAAAAAPWSTHRLSWRSYQTPPASAEATGPFLTLSGLEAALKASFTPRTVAEALAPVNTLCQLLYGSSWDPADVRLSELLPHIPRLLAVYWQRVGADSTASDPCLAATTASKHCQYLSMILGLPEVQECFSREHLRRLLQMTAGAVEQFDDLAMGKGGDRAGQETGPDSQVSAASASAAGAAPAAAAAAAAGVAEAASSAGQAPLNLAQVEAMLMAAQESGARSSNGWKPYLFRTSWAPTVYGTDFHAAAIQLTELLQQWEPWAQHLLDRVREGSLLPDTVIWYTYKVMSMLRDSPLAAHVGQQQLFALELKARDLREAVRTIAAGAPLETSSPTECKGAVTAAAQSAPPAAASSAAADQGRAADLTYSGLMAILQANYQPNTFGAAVIPVRQLCKLLPDSNRDPAAVRVSELLPLVPRLLDSLRQRVAGNSTAGGAGRLSFGTAFKHTVHLGRILRLPQVLLCFSSTRQRQQVLQAVDAAKQEFRHRAAQVLEPAAEEVHSFDAAVLQSVGCDLADSAPIPEVSGGGSSGFGDAPSTASAPAAAAGAAAVSSEGHAPLTLAQAEGVLRAAQKAGVPGSKRWETYLFRTSWAPSVYGTDFDPAAVPFSELVRQWQPWEQDLLARVRQGSLSPETAVILSYKVVALLSYPTLAAHVGQQQLAAIRAKAEALRETARALAAVRIVSSLLVGSDRHVSSATDPCGAAAPLPAPATDATSFTAAEHHLFALYQQHVVPNGEALQPRMFRQAVLRLRQAEAAGDRARLERFLQDYKWVLLVESKGHNAEAEDWQDAFSSLIANALSE